MMPPLWIDSDECVARLVLPVKTLFLRLVSRGNLDIGVAPLIPACGRCQL